KHRINDTRMLRLIQKWLKAGVLEDGVTASGLAAASRERPKAWPQPSSSMRFGCNARPGDRPIVKLRTPCACQARVIRLGCLALGLRQPRTDGDRAMSHMLRHACGFKLANDGRQPSSSMRFGCNARPGDRPIVKLRTPCACQARVIRLGCLALGL